MPFERGCPCRYLLLIALPQAYYRLGVALQGLDRYEEAMIAFAGGIAADPKQASMLNGLIETMLKSPLKGGCTRWLCYQPVPHWKVLRRN